MGLGCGRAGRLLVFAVLLRHLAFTGPQEVGRERRLSRRGPGGPEKLDGAEDAKPLSYYAGMLTNPPSEEDSEKDMITPTLKFVGYGALLGLAYLAIFVGLNAGNSP